MIHTLLMILIRETNFSNHQFISKKIYKAFWGGRTSSSHRATFESVPGTSSIPANRSMTVSIETISSPLTIAIISGEPNNASAKITQMIFLTFLTTRFG